MKGPLENIVVSVRSTGLASATPCFLPCCAPFVRPRRRSHSKPTSSPPLCGGGDREWLKSHRSKKRTDTRLDVCLFLVAEVGFEPHDLRVMSPTSYQAALLRDIKKYGAGNGNRTRTMLSHHGILSPGRLPIPPLRRIVYEDLSFDAHILYHFIFNMSIYF